MGQSLAKVVFAEGRWHRVEIETFGDGTVYLTFVEKFTEEIDFEKLAEFVEAIPVEVRKFRLDLRSVRQMNSAAMRGWASFVHRIQKRSEAEFVAVSEAFVDAANSIPALWGKAEPVVLAVEVPLFCPKCKERTQHFFRVEDLRFNDASVLLPDRSCEDCKGPLEADIDPKEYFKFLKLA